MFLSVTLIDSNINLLVSIYRWNPNCIIYYKYFSLFYYIVKFRLLLLLYLEEGGRET